MTEIIIWFLVKNNHHHNTTQHCLLSVYIWYFRGTWQFFHQVSGERMEKNVFKAMVMVNNTLLQDGAHMPEQGMLNRMMSSEEEVLTVASQDSPMFNTPCRTGLLVRSSLSLCLPEEVFISPSLLEDNVTGMEFEVGGFFFFLPVIYFIPLSFFAWRSLLSFLFLFLCR